MTTSDIAALKTSQTTVLNSADLVALTTAQISSLTTSPTMALTTAQVQFLTTTQVSVLPNFTTPLVLDLSGNGITTQSISAGAQFDLKGTGQAVNTGWVSGSGEGLLVYDPNNAPITSGSQLFGSATVLPNGQKAANGFAALSAMDTNGDGVITSADAGWSNLKVWVGESANGVVQGGQLRSLDSLGIVQLNLAATTTATMNNGNLIGMVSSFVTSNGQTHQMADVWFQTSPVQSTNAPVTTATAAATVAQSLSTSLNAQGLATAQIAALTTTQIAALAPPQVSALTTAAGLQSQVGGLVQAIGSFSQSQSTGASSSAVPLMNTQQNTAAATGVVGVSVSVAGMVGALQQFGQNGTPVVTPPIVGSVSTITTLTASPLPNSSNNGILASGK